MSNTPDPRKDLSVALRESFPELEDLRRVAGETPVYLVGGAVRDLLLGRERSDVDVVVEGDAPALAGRLGGEVVEHARFSTAKAMVGALEIDLASARAETYAAPGALPEVRPATLAEDLDRRDFTINAMAIPLQGEAELIDPLGGAADLDAGILRILHRGSFRDDPTRALRAARYAARFGFTPERETSSLLREADLGTVSDDRRRAELLRLTGEALALDALGLLVEWGLIEPPEIGQGALAALDRLLSGPPWSEVAERPKTLLAAALSELGRAPALAAAAPGSPSEGVELARGATPEELAIARALGAEWVEDYVRSWRSVVLEIGGADLIAAGVAEGPDIGRGLAAAMRGKLDGAISGRNQELEAALEAVAADRHD